MRLAALLDEDELRGDAPRLDEELRSLGRPEMVEEVAAEHALVGARRERKRQRVGMDDGGVRNPLRRDGEHVGARVEERQLAGQVL